MPRRYRDVEVAFVMNGQKETIVKTGLTQSEKIQLADEAEPLVSALVEIEHYVSNEGWDRPERLFALVPTAELIAAEPSLTEKLSLSTPDALSAIEQDDFFVVSDLGTALANLTWPQTVAGVALATERVFLPSDLEDSIPADPKKAATYVASHPQREEVRVVAGALRDGRQYSLVRVGSQPSDLLFGPDLVPGLSEALANMFKDSR